MRRFDRSGVRLGQYAADRILAAVQSAHRGANAASMTVTKDMKDAGQSLSDMLKSPGEGGS